MIFYALLILSSLTSIISLKKMKDVSKKHGGIKATNRQILEPFVLGAISFFIVLDSAGFLLLGESFIHSVLYGGSILDIIISAGAIAIVGMAIDFGGIYLTNLWEYPPVSRKRILYLLYVPMWSLFGFCMQLFWLFIETLKLGFIGTFVLVTLIGAVSLELPNKFGYAWVYKGIFKNPIMLTMGWFLLTLTNVVWIVEYVVNPINLNI